MESEPLYTLRTLLAVTMIGEPSVHWFFLAEDCRLLKMTTSFPVVFWLELSLSDVSVYKEIAIFLNLLFEIICLICLDGFWSAAGLGLANNRLLLAACEDVHVMQCGSASLLDECCFQGWFHPVNSWFHVHYLLFSMLSRSPDMLVVELGGESTQHTE